MYSILNKLKTASGVILRKARPTKEVVFSYKKILSPVLIVAVSFGIIFTGYSAYAKPHTQMNPTEEIKSWLYYNSLSACINKAGITGSSMTNTMDPEGVNNSKWFNAAGSNNGRAIGYTIGVAGVSVDGFPRDTDKAAKVECGGSNMSWIKDALSLWGYQSNLEAWCDLTGNLKRKDGTVCMGSASTQGWNANDATKAFKENFQKVIKNKIYNGNDPSRSDAARYVHARNAFIGGCTATSNTIPSPYTGSDSGGTIYNDVKIVDEEGNVKSLKIAGVHNSGRKISYSVTPGNYSNVSETCGNLVNQMSRYAAAYSSYIAMHGVDTPDSGYLGEPESESTTSCIIPGVGWILCPAISFIGGITDGMYSFISDSLNISPGLFSTDSATYRGWSEMRNIANVGLVIVFLLIIFSQLTSFGISNYGIKRMLPRLVIAVILINISFFVCQLAIDISNILGVSLKSTIDAIPLFPKEGSSTEASGFWASGNGLSNAIITILAGSGTIVGVGAIAIGGGALIAFYGGIGLLIMVILAGLLSVAIAFFIISARMALAVILIVVAPLAFLAMILPNTKNWFDKWKTIFIAILAIYPMFALLFGFSQLASNILIQNASAKEVGPEGLIMLVIGIGAALIPLFAVIPMLKGSLNAVPMVGKFAQKFSKSNPLSGQAKAGIKDARAGAMLSARNAAAGGRFGKTFQRMSTSRAIRNQKRQALTGNIQRAEAEAVSSSILNDDSASLSSKASAISAQNKLAEEEISNILALDKHNGMSPEDHLARVQDANASVPQRVASIRALKTEGGQGNVDKLLRTNSMPHLSLTERQALADVAASKSDNNPAMGGLSIKEITNGTMNEHDSYKRYASGNDFNAQKFVNMHSNSRASMLRSLSGQDENGKDMPDYTPSSDAIAGMKRVLGQIETNPELQAKVTTAEIDNLRRTITVSESKQRLAEGSSLKSEQTQQDTQQTQVDQKINPQFSRGNIAPRDIEGQLDIHGRAPRTLSSDAGDTNTPPSTPNTPPNTPQ